MGTLSPEEARRTYDRIGILQDTQRFYEDRATGLLVRHGAFPEANAVFEFGCGTGRFARNLLERHLSRGARYRGVDVSPRMVRLARSRVAPYSERAEVLLTDGGPPVSEADGSCDRFVSNYVLDLLSHDDIRHVLGEAHRMLRPGGVLCLAGLTGGVGVVSRLVSGAFRLVHAIRPALAGGCRPVEIREQLRDSEWDVSFHSKVVAFGVPSEVVVARRA